MKMYEEVFEILFNTLPYVFWKDLNGKYLGGNLNQARNLGFDSPDEFIGKTIFEILHDKEAAQLIDEIDNKVMREKVTLVYEEKLATLSGERIYLSQKSPIINKNGDVVGMVGFSMDITDRKKMEEELRLAKEAAEAASRSKTAFIANISHDTRTPLTGLIGLSCILEEKGISEDERIQYAQLIHESGDKLLEFSESVLDDVTAETMNDDAVLYESFDVRKIIHDVMALEGPTTKVNHLDIKTHIDESIPPYLVGDRMKIHRILLNLAGNAIKFTKVGGLELNARLCKRHNNEATVEFSVKDTGIGIAPEHQSKVFDQFYKISPSYKGQYKGYGLGLHIVQKFVSLLGGEIHLESEPDIGTTISFVLTMKIGEKPAVEARVQQEQPIARRIDVAPPQISETVVAEVCQPHELNKLQVLLVEDNNSAMLALKMMVKKLDVQIMTAVDAEKAFELVQSQPFDLVITDLGLPGKQGDDLSRMIRVYEEENQYQPMMIVGLTGHAVEEIAAQCIDAGMNEVYRKPMPMPTLTLLIDSLVKKEKMGVEVVPQSTGGLGVDLPNTGAELFEIYQYPLLDLNVGAQVLGSEEVVREILTTLKVDAIDEDLALIKIARANNNWNEVERLSHKMKGGSDFGTVRMHYALLYMERYRKAGHTELLEELYTQMLQVIDETMAYLDEWLKTG